MGLILSNYRLGGNNSEPDKGTPWPNAYCRFRAGGQDLRNAGGMSAILCVQIWPSAADYAAAKSGDATKVPLSVDDEQIQITDQADMIALLTGNFGDWQPPLDGSGNPIGGLQLMAAYAVRNMPRWQGAWE